MNPTTGATENGLRTCSCVNNCQCSTEAARLRGSSFTSSHNQPSNFGLPTLSSVRSDTEDNDQSQTFRRERKSPSVRSKQTAYEADMYTAHEKYADILFTFSRRQSAQTLFSGENYQVLSDFLGTSSDQAWLDDSLSNGSIPDDDSSSFVVLHDLKISRSQRQRIHDCTSFSKFQDTWDELQGNRVLFLRGYPSREWLCRLGAKLDLDYEFLNRHFSNPDHRNLAENYCYPPLPLTCSNTIQLTITSVGVWDNYQSGIGLADARKSFEKEMKAYTMDMNRGRGLKTCDSVVRDFYLHDLKHFSIEQTLTINLIPRDGFWTSKLYFINGAKSQMPD